MKTIALISLWRGHFGRRNATRIPGTQHGQVLNARVSRVENEVVPDAANSSNTCV
jgi:hypothetical protein